MTVRVTARLAKQIGVSTPVTSPLAENPYTDWTCRLFSVTDGFSLVLITNTASLYSLLIPWGGPMDIAQFRNVFLGHLQQHMLLDGFGAIHTAYIEREADNIVFAKSLNRSVTGSMNDMIRLAEFMLVEERESLAQASTKLNDTPFGTLNYDHPRQRFASLAK